MKLECNLKCLHHKILLTNDSESVHNGTNNKVMTDQVTQHITNLAYTVTQHLDYCHEADLTRTLAIKISVCYYISYSCSEVCALLTKKVKF